MQRELDCSIEPRLSLSLSLSLCMTAAPAQPSACRTRALHCLSTPPLLLPLAAVVLVLCAAVSATPARNETLRLVLLAGSSHQPRYEAQMLATLAAAMRYAEEHLQLAAHGVRLEEEPLSLNASDCASECASVCASECASDCTSDCASKCASDCASNCASERTLAQLRALSELVARERERNEHLVLFAGDAPCLDESRLAAAFGHAFVDFVRLHLAVLIVIVM